MKNKTDIIGSIALIILICLFGMFFIWTWKNPINTGTSIDYDALGTYGDFFGGVIGTLFAIAGVVYVYFTYKNQIGISV